MKNEFRLESDVTKQRTSLHGVDLSYRNITSAPLGMLVPTMVQEVVGKSKVRIGLESQTRCRPLAVPSFVRIREHFDYFFVPYSQLWHQYDNFKTLQANYNSTLVNDFQDSSIPSSVPAVGYNVLGRAIIGADSSTDPQKDVAGYPLADGMMRIMDNLGYGINTSIGSGVINIPSGLNVNLFRALAYQKIYSDYYRNDKYEGNYPEHYNVDDLKFGDNVDDERLWKIFEPHYRWRKKDYFTSVWPNDMPNDLLFGFEGFKDYFRFGNMTDDPNTFVTNTMPEYKNRILNVIGGSSSQNTVLNDGSDFTDNKNMPSSVRVTIDDTGKSQSASEHRLLAAQERYLRRLYASKQNFPAIMEAIFGYSPKIGRSGAVTQLGGISNLVSVQDVNNTSSPDVSSPAGKINTYNSGNKIVDDFYVPEDGIIMCIYSTSVENDYRSNQLSRNNVKRQPEEFYNPNYERLGRQPLFGFEYKVSIQGSTPDNFNSLTRVIGYQKRYSEYLTHVDEVHGAFASDSFSPYSCYMNNDLPDDAALSLTSLIIGPYLIRDIISGGVYDGQPEGDHFYLNFYNKVDCLTPINVTEDY